MTKIKIHDEAWFAEHCCKSVVSPSMSTALIPNHPYWEKLDAEVLVMYWLGGIMNTLAGKVLEVDLTDIKGEHTGKIYGSKYHAGGYWIPNWAIEWVMEVA